MTPRRVAVATQRRVTAYPATIAGLALFWVLVGAYQLAHSLFG